MTTSPHLFLFPNDRNLHLPFPFQTNPQYPFEDSDLNLNGGPHPIIKSASQLLPGSHPHFFENPSQNGPFENPCKLSKHSSMLDTSDSFFDIQDRSQEEQPSSPSSFLSSFEEDLSNSKYDDLIKDFLISGIDKNSKIIQKKPIETKPIPANSSNTAQARKRQTWRPEEDALVMELIEKHGQRWNIISKFVDNRNGKQIRDRYLNVLMSNINKSSWTDAEDQLIISLYEEHGPKWRQIAHGLQGRTESQVKNRFHTHLKGRYSKRLQSVKTPSPFVKATEKQANGWIESYQSPQTASTCSESPESLNCIETVGYKGANFIDTV